MGLSENGVHAVYPQMTVLIGNMMTNRWLDGSVLFSDKPTCGFYHMFFFGYVVCKYGDLTKNNCKIEETHLRI